MGQVIAKIKSKIFKKKKTAADELLEKKLASQEMDGKVDTRKKNSLVYDIFDYIDMREEIDKWELRREEIAALPEAERKKLQEAKKNPDADPDWEADYLDEEEEEEIVTPRPEYNDLHDREIRKTIILRKQGEKIPEEESSNPRTAKLNKVAESIARGNFRAFKAEVIQHYSAINRNYEGQWKGRTLLHIVCEHAYREFVEFIVNPKNKSIFESVNLNVDQPDDNGRTPLHYCFKAPQATWLGQRYGVNENTGLYETEKEESCKDMDFFRPGTLKDRKTIVGILLSNGADPGNIDYHDYTPLHLACQWGWTDTVALLLRNGVEPDTVNILGQSPLMMAVSLKHFDTVEYLLEYAEVAVNTRDHKGATALFYAINNEDVDLVELLCDFGADVQMKNFNKVSALEAACITNNAETVNLLLDYKAARRMSAIDLMDGTSLKKVKQRLDRELKDEEARLAAERKGFEAQGAEVRYRNPRGQWVPYLDKQGRGVFYYNKVSRNSQFEEPADYVVDKRHIMTQATFGMNFYH